MSDYKLAKTKVPQIKTPNEQQQRDLFLTPVYATNLLLPHIPSHVEKVWDVGAGNHNITKVLKEFGFSVLSTDIDGSKQNIQQNFVADAHLSSLVANSHKIDCIVGNPPFSLKKEFIDTAISINLPFAFLIPFDMSGYLWDMFRNKGLQGIVPERRIDFITPNVISRANEYLGIYAVNKEFEIKAKSYRHMMEFFRHIPFVEDTYHANVGKYETIESIPNALLRKVSSSDFHSFWIVRGFDMEKDFTFVELSNENKNHIF